MFTLFYVSIYLYPNDLKANLQKVLKIPHLLIFFIIQALSFWLFLRAGDNPGFVDETETPMSRREKAKLFVGQYDEFKGVEEAAGASSIISEGDGTDGAETKAKKRLNDTSKSYEVLDETAGDRVDTGKVDEES